MARSSDLLVRGLIAVSVAALTFGVSGVAAQESGDSGDENGAESTAADDGESGDEAGNGSEASGAREARLALLPTVGATDEVSSIVPDRIDEMLRKRIGQTGRVELLAPFAVAYREDRESTSNVVQEAREQYRSGLGLANAGKFEKAAEPLSSAVETLRNNISRLGKFSVYTDALLKLAWSYWNIDHNYDARKSIREYAHLRPDADLDSKKYPEKLLEVYRSEVQKVEEAGTGKLVIETKPEGSTVWIDGEEHGESPVTVRSVGFGYHYLVVEGPEGRRKAKRLRVRGRGEEQTYSLDVGGDANGEDGSDEEAEDDEKLPAFYRQLRGAVGDGVFERSSLKPYLEEMARRTNASHIAWVVMTERDSSYEAAPFVYRADDGALVAADRVDFSIQLAAMRVNVRKLQKTLLAHVDSMPDEDVVASVDLPPKRGESADESSEETERTEADGEAQEADEEAASEDETKQRASKGESVEPPPEPDEEESSDESKGPTPWTYVGIGGATIAVGGAVVGGVLLFDDSGGAPANFSATVTW